MLQLLLPETEFTLIENGIVCNFNRIVIVFCSVGTYLHFITF